MQEAMSVSSLTLYIKNLMDRDGLLTDVLVCGEISNYKAYPSGHHYFSVKDAEGSIRAVMFRREAASLRFHPENGMRVLISGRVTVFARDGQYQLYANRMIPDGAGDLSVAFEQLKVKLYEEGLFDVAHKKPLPAYPQKIALVTSPTGAVVHDMIEILNARYPLAEVYVFPVRVQGKEAAAEICHALSVLNRRHQVDLIITGRGGGSMEDLWAFNEECVAREIYRSEIPIISAVGHEPDVTIADFVADVRAATPSNAAEIAVPDQNELYAHILGLARNLNMGLQNKVKREKQNLERFENHPFLKYPLRHLQERRLRLDEQQQKLEHGFYRCLSEQKQCLGQFAASMDALSPLKVLGRGYAIAQKKDGTVITSIKHICIHEALEVRVSDGTFVCRREGNDNGG
ncbi:MAG: exodeoxyribonuclease VII large subunit [Evtepia sp.]